MIFMNRLRKNVWCLQGNEVLNRHILVHEIGRLTGCNFDDSYIFIVKNRIFVSGNCKTFLFSNPLGIFIGISFSLRQVATCTWIRYLDSPASVERPVLRAKKKKRQQLRERVVIGVLPRAACIMTGLVGRVGRILRARKTERLREGAQVRSDGAYRRLARVWNNYFIPRVEISPDLYICVCVCVCV